MTSTLKKRIDCLYEEEVRRWREAWIAFWTDVWRPFTEHELAFASTVPRHDEDRARWSEVEPVVIAECTPWEQEDDEAWLHWTCAVDAFLGRCPADELFLRMYEVMSSSPDIIRRALAVWPSQFPAPPEEHPGAWDRLKMKVGAHQEAGDDQAVLEAGIAAHLVGYLSMARAVRIRLTTGAV